MPGDCGSWVADIQHGTIHGMIVATSHPAQESYFVPANDTFNSIKAKWSTTDIRFPTRTVMDKERAVTISSINSVISPRGSEFSSVQSGMSSVHTGMSSVHSGISSVSSTGGAKLFIGGLAWHTTDDTLREGFTPFGTVEEALVVKDRNTKGSRGFGYVRFAELSEAEEAISKMNQVEFDGRTILVQLANPSDRAPIIHQAQSGRRFDSWYEGGGGGREWQSGRSLRGLTVSGYGGGYGDSEIGGSYGGDRWYGQQSNTAPLRRGHDDGNDGKEQTGSRDDEHTGHHHR